MVSQPPSNKRITNQTQEPLSSEMREFIHQLQQERDEAVRTLRIIQTSFETPELHGRVAHVLDKIDHTHSTIHGSR